MPAHRNIGIEGIDCDSTPAFSKPEKAYMITNGSILSEDLYGSGAVSNIKGNALSFIIPDLSNAKSYTDPFNQGFTTLENLLVIGNTNLRDDIVLFTTNETGIPNGSYGQIWTLRYNYDNEVEWVHDLNSSDSFVAVKFWNNAVDGKLLAVGDDTLFNPDEKVIISNTYTDDTGGSTLFTIGEVWKFVSNGVWSKVTGAQVDKNLFIVNNGAITNFKEPVLSIINELPLSPTIGDRYILIPEGSIYEYNGAGWEIDLSAMMIPGTSTFVVDENIRYYWNGTSLGWLNTYNIGVQNWVWIGDVAGLNFDSYIGGWHRFYTNTLMPGIHLKYFNQLDFSQKYRIKAIGNVEDEDIGKIYWVDGYNVLRHLNLYDSNAYAIPVNQIDIVANVEFSQLKTRVTTGGVYKAGALQYSYQLYKKNGPETSFSPPSDLLSLSSGNYMNGNDSDFRGTQYQEPDLAENTTKAANILIEDIDTNFEYIKICALFYDIIGSQPRIRLIYDGIIPTDRKISFIDSGAINLRTYTSEEYNMIGGMYIKPNDVETIDNRLIVANYNESTFDVDYDARAYKWKVLGNSLTIVDTNVYNEVSELSAILSTDDCVGGTSGYHYLQNDDDVTEDWGGTGLNVSYQIKLYQIEIDSNKDFYGEGGANVYFANNTYLDLSVTLDDTFLGGNTYTSYAGDLIKSQLVGYQRGETYRFGVVFIDIKGRRSPVKWIDDIKMPVATDLNTNTTYSIGATAMYDFAPFFTVIDTNSSVDKREWIATTYANIMYVEFTLNNLPADVVSYQIVRMERGEEDSTVICSGYFLPTSDMFAQDTHALATNMEIKYDGGAAYAITAANVFSDNITVHPVGSIINHTSLYNWNDGTIAMSADNYLIPRMMHTLYDIGGHIKAFQDADCFPNAFEVITPDVIYSRSSIPNGSRFIIYGGTNDWAFFNNDLDDQDPPEADAFLNRDTFFKLYGLDYLNKVDTGAPTSISVDIDFAIFPTSDWYETRNNGHYLPGNRYAAYATRMCMEAKVDDQYKNFNAKKGITLICYTEDSLPTKTLAPFGSDSGAHDYQYLYGYIYVERSAQYGGQTFNARTGNEYIECSHIYPRTTTTAKVFGGDTYISMFEYNRVFCDLELEYCERNDTGGLNNNHKSQKTTYTETIICPIETRYCLDYRGDKTRTQESTQSYSYLMQEQLGNWEPDNNSDSEVLTIFSQETDLYIYNPVYSQTQNIRRHYSPFVFEIGEDNDVRYDARIAISELKINNQLSDSWLKFLPNNYLDAQYNYGRITGIKEFNSGLLVFQESAVGFVPVNEQALINSGLSTSLLSLGTGALIGKLQYMSTTSGTINRDAVVKTGSGVYYYDEKHNEIYVIDKPLAPMTKIKGVNSYLKQNVESDIVDNAETLLTQGVVGAYDQSTGRIYFSFGRAVGNFTIVYNEILQNFESVLTISPYIFITDKSRLISSGHWNGEGETTYVGKSFYLHDVGDYGKFFDMVYPFSIEFIINPEYSMMKVFDNFELTFNCSDKTVFFDSVTVGSQYNVNEELGFTSTNSQYRFLKWRTLVPRIDGSRAFGNYIKAKFIYDNYENLKVSLEDLITHYRIHGMPFN